MSVILYIYYYFNVAFGVLNVSFDSVTNKFRLFHWPTIIYCILVHLFTTTWQIYSFKMYWDDNVVNTSNPGQLISYANVIVSNTAFTICVLKVWLQRQRSYKVLEQFEYLYKRNLSNNKSKYLCNIRKHLLFKCIAIIFQLIFWVYAMSDITNLSEDCIDLCFTKLMISISFNCFKDLYFLLMDMNIYFGLIFLYMCGQVIMHRLNDIKNELEIKKIFISSYEDEDNAHLQHEWRQKLQNDVFVIIRLEHQLKYLFNNFILLFQCQLIMLLINSFVGLIHIMIYVLYTSMEIFLLGYRDYLVIATLSSILPYMAMSMINVVLVFVIWEALLKSFKEITQKVFEVVLQDLLLSKVLLPKEDSLKRNVWN